MADFNSPKTELDKLKNILKDDADIIDAEYSVSEGETTALAFPAEQLVPPGVKPSHVEIKIFYGDQQNAPLASSLANKTVAADKALLLTKKATKPRSSKAKVVRSGVKGSSVVWIFVLGIALGNVLWILGLLKIVGDFQNSNSTNSTSLVTKLLPQWTPEQYRQLYTNEVYRFIRDGENTEGLKTRLDRLSAAKDLYNTDKALTDAVYNAEVYYQGLDYLGQQKYGLAAGKFSQVWAWLKGQNFDANYSALLRFKYYLSLLNLARIEAQDNKVKDAIDHLSEIDSRNLYTGDEKQKTDQKQTVTNLLNEYKQMLKQ